MVYIKGSYIRSDTCIEFNLNLALFRSLNVTKAYNSKEFQMGVGKFIGGKPCFCCVPVRHRANSPGLRSPTY